MNSYLEAAQSFVENMPYHKSPYNGRNWGHSWHSLCSYHGKLKPAIAHFLVSSFTKEGDVILDPLCGVGTIPFEASLQGRIGIGNDLSELAYCVSKAKLEKPSYDEVIRELEKLHQVIEGKKSSYGGDVLPYSGFGLNHTIGEYFHRDTLIELLIAREYFLKDFEDLSAPKAMVFAALLHVLHGNRPYALSRTSHPLTPYAPRGEYVYKNVIDHVRDKIELAYKETDFNSFVKGKAIYGDFVILSGINADAIITSPPFADSMKFYTQNWMRLWMCGWEPNDFKSASGRFLDQKQNKDFDVYIPFFEMCASNLKGSGKLILHLGKTKKIDMAEELSQRSRQWFEEIYRGDESVSSIEKHGIKDKGGTIEHQYLFLIKK